ncbi:hypothetical protein K450DRAFT_258669 [Umbelopsis ramanniana AG]|uniref:Uncharacterized protein n=1 Tax=Umbelopsis ramanniana AG TaxID=1314678 RepID=A0AAD5E5L4_UMBRA|nr:uncharacterized protein K450DRAFT_258669 [Umbelopsis ramanniana AG]KAI8576055.1 hypothetical protein K450DRAFT_258669 [Umbelopsis ramanniana AG]
MATSRDNGIKLQWSTKNDIDRLCSAMEPVFQPPDEKIDFVTYLVRDQYKRWALGESSFMTPEDTVFATDTNTKDDKIVAFTTLWKDKQLYNGIGFSIGRVEFVGVVSEYRNQGLMPRIMDAVHEASDLRGDLMQTIVGIPYYYRQFDYEYALDIGKRSKTWLNSIPSLKSGEKELTTLRAATLEDLDIILNFDQVLSLQSCNYAPLRREYLETQIKGSINSTASPFQRRVVMFEDDGHAIGYFIMHNYADSSAISVLHIAFKPNINLPTIINSILRGIVQYSSRSYDEKSGENLTAIFWHFSEWHPFFNSLPSCNRSYTSLPDEAYSTYVRIPNYANFIRHIIPVLNDRLANAKSWSCYNGVLYIHNYTKKYMGVRIQIDGGHVSKVEDWFPTDRQQPVSNQIHFPPLTFTNILLGNKSLEELQIVYPDIAVSDLTAQLVNVLFPKSVSINHNWV